VRISDVISTHDGRPAVGAGSVVEVIPASHPAGDEDETGQLRAPAGEATCVPTWCGPNKDP
jgi:hypothetical protein